MEQFAIVTQEPPRGLASELWRFQVITHEVFVWAQRLQQSVTKVKGSIEITLLVIITVIVMAQSFWLPFLGRIDEFIGKAVSIKSPATMHCSLTSASEILRHTVHYTKFDYYYHYCYYLNSWRQIVYCLRVSLRWQQEKTRGPHLIRSPTVVSALWELAYYMPHDAGDVPTITPAKAGTRFIDPGGMKGWVDLSMLKQISYSRIFRDVQCMWYERV